MSAVRLHFSCRRQMRIDFISKAICEIATHCLRSVRRLSRLGVRLYGANHDPLDQATGLEKRELLAHLAGDCDPFRMIAIKKGPGTCERPNLIPSANCGRLMCCLCDPNDMHLEFMYLHMGEPKRCGCGYWFELCPVAPL